MSKYIQYFDVANKQLEKEISSLGTKDMPDIFENVIKQYGEVNYDLDRNKIIVLASEMKKVPYFVNKFESLIKRNLNVLKYAQENGKKVWDRCGLLLQVEGEMPFAKKYYNPLYEINIKRMVLAYNESGDSVFDGESSYSKELMKIMYNNFTEDDWNFIMSDNLLADKFEYINNIFKEDMKNFKKESQKIKNILKKNAANRLIGEELYFENLMDLEYKKQDRLYFFIIQNLIEKIKNFDFNELNANNFSKLGSNIKFIFEEIIQKNSAIKRMDINSEDIFSLSMGENLSKEENRSTNIEQFIKIVNFKKLLELDKKDVEKYLQLWATSEPETFNLSTLMKAAINGKTSTYRDMNDKFNNYTWLAEQNKFKQTKDFEENNYDIFIVNNIVHDKNLWLELDVKRLSYFIGDSENEAMSGLKRIARAFENKLYKNNLSEYELKDKHIENIHIELENSADKKTVAIDILMEAMNQTTNSKDLKDLFNRLNREFDLMNKMNGSINKIRAKRKI